MNDFFSECQNLILGCRLTLDAGLTLPVVHGKLSNGALCYTTNQYGYITSIDPCGVTCDLAISNVTSTDPTTLGGTDGTITITFSTSNGPSAYTVNGGPPAIAVSPLVITGLSSGVDYTVLITDDNNCQEEATVTLGQSATLFNADWIMVTYQFTDGTDLDTRTRIALPNIGQDTQPEYLGWNLLSAFGPPLPSSSVPVAADHIINWGGDNQGTGFESVLVNVKKFRLDFPAATSFTVDLRAFWFGTLGVQPVIAAVTLWKDASPPVGTPVHNACPQGPNFYCWSYPGALFTGSIASVPKIITLDTTASASPGERVATLNYNLTTFVAVLNNNDTSTPEVL